MFEQAFRNIDDVLRKEAGCTTGLDYTEQTRPSEEANSHFLAAFFNSAFGKAEIDAKLD